MEIISRTYYAKRVDAWLGKGQIIVLVGQRRVGKSFVLKDFVIRHKTEPNANIIYIDKEKKDFNYIQNHETSTSISPLASTTIFLSTKCKTSPVGNTR